MISYVRKHKQALKAEGINYCRA